MKAQFSETAITVRPYIGIALMLGLTVFANPAFAAEDIGFDAIKDVGEGIWEFMIENVILVAFVLGALGALLGGFFGNPSQAIGRMIVCAFIGVLAAGVPFFAEWAMSKAGGGTIAI